MSACPPCLTSQADGDTALYVAAKAGHDEAVRALLEVQATKVNWQNHKGAQGVVQYVLNSTCTAASLDASRVDHPQRCV